MKILSALIVLLMSIAVAYANVDDLVNSNLRLLAAGKINEVKNQLPDLLAEYPNEPGIKLLHAAVLNDADKAIEIYREIIRTSSQSQWADDAYWRIVQYYAVLGDTSTAKSELSFFRERYPTSIYLGPASDVVNSAIDVAKTNKRSFSVTKVVPSTKEEPTKTINNENSTVKSEMSMNPLNERTPELKIEESKDVIHLNTEEEVYEEEKAPTLSMDNEIDSKIESEIEVAPIADNEIEEDEKSDEPLFYGLQVGIYQNYDTAESEKQKFLSKRMRTEVTEKKVNGRTMYAVVIGNYSTLESAEAAKIIVNKQCECDPIIYRK